MLCWAIFYCMVLRRFHVRLAQKMSSHLFLSTQSHQTCFVILCCSVLGCSWICVITVTFAFVHVTMIVILLNQIGLALLGPFIRKYSYQVDISSKLEKN